VVGYLFGEAFEEAPAMTVNNHTASKQSGKANTALVIGATGGVGGEVAHALLSRGWRVRALARDPAAARRRAAWIGEPDWVCGDAMEREAVIRAAAGVDLIFHGANPPYYRNWRGLALPMLGNAIAAARETGARLIFPGNVYNYGPDAGSLIAETAAQHPATRKGAVRVEMEQMLQAAASSGVRSIVVRAGDFFGVHQPAAWFKDAMVKPGRAVRAVTYPGDPAAGHAWAYLPDLAATIVALAEIASPFDDFETFHFGGHWFERGDKIIGAIARVTGVPELPTKRFPWPLLRLGAAFSPFFRELLEMRYLWERPIRLDNRKLVALLGAEPHTPLETAIRAVLRSLGIPTLPEEAEAPRESAISA
jgi:nucleoside-diphosphate-sugar epimerase